MALCVLYRTVGEKCLQVPEKAVIRDGAESSRKSTVLIAVFKLRILFKVSYMDHVLPESHCLAFPCRPSPLGCIHGLACS